MGRRSIWTPEERHEHGAVLVERYETGSETVEQLAAVLGRSYGFTYKLLAESGVTFKTRGGRPRTPGKPRGATG